MKIESIENDSTGRIPRNLQEAFGPYTSHQLSAPARPMDWQDKIVLAASIVAFAVVVFMVLL